MVCGNSLDRSEDDILYNDKDSSGTDSHYVKVIYHESFLTRFSEM